MTRSRWFPEEEAEKPMADHDTAVDADSLRERISYAIAIGAKGKRYWRIVRDGERIPGKSAATIHERVKMVAYELWRQEGMPEGRAQAHWDEATRRVLAETRG